MFPPCLREGLALLEAPGVPAGCMSVMLGIKSGGRVRNLTGGGIPREQGGPGLPKPSDPPEGSDICSDDQTYSQSHVQTM